MVPKHVGIIMDGNRRFSKKLMKKPWMGHEWGAKKFEKVLLWLQEFGVKEATFYCLSLENFNRPKKEFDYLMNIFRKNFDKLIKDERIEKNKIRLRFVGKLNLLPADLQEKIKILEEKTRNYNGFIVNFAIAYSGRAEIIDAVNKIVQRVKAGEKVEIDETNFGKELYLSSEPDLIIRTSGEQRTSGFLIWQGSYAELYFCSKLWPEFEKEDLQKAILSYENRERRFGK